MKKKTSKKDALDFKGTAEDLKFEVSNNASSFGFISSIIPIPVHLLSSNISKADRYLISRMVSMRVNEAMAQAAKTLQYVSKKPKTALYAKRIVKNSAFVVKYGNKDAATMKKLWDKTSNTKLTADELNAFR